MARRTQASAHAAKPAKDQDLPEWEATWERKLAFIRLPSFPLRQCFTRRRPRSVSEVYDGTAHLMQVELQLEVICKMQHDLAKRASAEIAYDDFEGKWCALAPSHRAELLLGAISRACTTLDPGKDARMWAPDVSVQALNARGGEAYLDMLNALMPDDLGAPPSEPKHLPFPAFDEAIGHALQEAERSGQVGDKYDLILDQCIRDLLCSVVVWYTLLAFYGEEEARYLIKSVRSTKDREKYEDKDAVMSTEASSKDLNAHKVCHYCKKRGELMGCKQCREAAGRVVLYCSRECQKADWKSGMPRPHKMICGDKSSAHLQPSVAAPRAPGTLEPRDVGIPEATPPFIRSPALLHQIRALTRHPYWMDYVIMRPHPHPDYDLHFEDVDAMNTGDAASAKDIARMLIAEFGDRGVRVDGVQAQISREYSISVSWSSIPDWDPRTFTREDIKEVVDQMLAKDEHVRAVLEAQRVSQPTSKDL